MSRRKQSSTATTTMSSSDYGELLWCPTDAEVDASNLASFVAYANNRRRHGHAGNNKDWKEEDDLDVRDYARLHEWSVNDSSFQQFWQTYVEWGGIRLHHHHQQHDNSDKSSSSEPVVVYEGPATGCLPGGRWWPGSTFNYAENLLKGPAASQPPPLSTSSTNTRSSCNSSGGSIYEDPEIRAQRIALVSLGETRPRQELSYGALTERVARLRQSLVEGLKFRKGDRCLFYMANSIETVVGSLAVHAAGGVVSTCSPDFGIQGAMARIQQVQPSILFAVDGYVYNGKMFDDDVLERVKQIAALATSKDDYNNYLRHIVLVPYLRSPEEVERIVQEYNNNTTSSTTTSEKPRMWSWSSLMASPASQHNTATPAAAVVKEHYEMMCSSDPLYIMFTSGTTGRPKCIVHSAIGVLTQIAKEHHLHMDLRPGDVFIYFTTCGWMVWNYLIAGLYTGSTIILYDGSPVRTPNTCWDIVEKEKVSVLGLSARYVQLCEKKGLRPRETHNLDHLRSICVSASVLPPQSFRYVYRHVKTDIRLCSQSGGTDLLSAFLGVNPTLPVYCGELQPPCLGMDVDVFDVHGKSTRSEIGELVCKTVFPSMPLYFLNDPDGHLYHAAYFETFPNVWAQGDLAVWRPSGGMVLLGRSDAVLNPAGVRFGTAEIYQSLDAFEEIADSVVVSFTKEDGDVAVILFVQTAHPDNGDTTVLAEPFKARLRDKIRKDNTPRHVPHLILACPQVPRTRTMKVSEKAVRECIHKRKPTNQEALADPKSLSFFLEIADKLPALLAPPSSQSRL